MNILIVDDEKEIIDLYVLILEKAGHKITSTVLPQEALKLINNNDYDLVITDKKMPQISGLEIIKSVEEKKDNTVVFLITGDNTETLNFQNANSKVLKKPISLSDLSQAVLSIA